MLYELRRYDVAAGKLPALIDRFGNFTVQKWKQFGIRLIGFWTPLMGEKSSQVVYMWGWETYEERARKLAPWRSDPERIKVWAESEKNGPLVNRVYNQLMEPTAYSQLDRGEAYGPDASTRNPYMFELREYQAMPQKIAMIGQYAFAGAGAVITRDVPDYALVVGNPARVQGWMCACGVKLKFSPAGEEERAECGACGCRYSKRGGQVAPV